ncbi:MAG: hypothetical protein COB02_08860 [Candidatus Cloacimonadota bacterium]|nr:MAG: hypothetical protein COB02_08860 [Candidatus Cloacimonadota bacterium]
MCKSRALKRGQVRKVLLYGLGKSNLALYRLMLLDDNLKILVTGDNIIFPDEILKEHRSLLKDIEIDQFDDVYVTPGISEKHSLFLKCEPKNEIDYAYNFIEAKFIGITGSNGKSTTCKLLADALEFLGKKVKIAGNYGTPLSQVVLESQFLDYVVIELSSFQLRVLRDIQFESVVITNIEPNHLDWHIDMDSYKNSKLSILQMLNENGQATLESDKICGSPRIPHIFSIDTKLDFVPMNQDKLSQWRSIFPTLKQLSCDTKQLSTFNFVSLEHRMQHLLSKSGIICINDSKSTTPGSTLFALDCIAENNILLILGGKSKGLDLTEFLTSLSLYKNKIDKLYIYGDLQKNINQIKNTGIEFSSVCLFSDLLILIKKEIVKSQILVLSPAFSSLDQFQSFEERGQVFQSFIEEI